MPLFNDYPTTNGGCSKSFYHLNSLIGPTEILRVKWLRKHHCHEKCTQIKIKVQIGSIWGNGMASHYFQIVVISVADSEPYWNSDIFIFETGPIVRWWDFDFIVGIWSGWYMYCVVLILNKVPCNNKCHFWILSVTGRRSPDWLDQIAAGGITQDRNFFLFISWK